MVDKTFKILEALGKNMGNLGEEVEASEEAFKKKNKLYAKFRSATDGYDATFDEAEDFACRILAEIILKESVSLDIEEDEVVKKIIRKMVKATNEYRNHLYPLVISALMREEVSHGRI